MINFFEHIIEKYSIFQKEKQYLESASMLINAQKLLDEIRDSGKTIGDYEKRKTLSNLAIQLGEIIFDNSNIYPPVRISAYTPNPFVSGRHVQSDEFINREHELRTVFNRLQNADSTAIVGEPRIGKTSFLVQIANAKTQQNYLGDNFRELIFSHFDFHYIDNGFTPALFWEKSLRPLQKLSQLDDVAFRLKQFERTGYDSEPLVEFFDYFDEQGQQLILIFDEFEMLLNHPNFQEFSFYATLRAVATHRSCSLILASRNSLTELQEYINKLPFSGGSPVLNFLIELRLKPFDDKNAEILLARAGNTLSSKDKLIILFIAGHHPYLIQTMAACLMETTGDTRHQTAIEQFCNSTRSHFDDSWRALPDRERTTVLVLGLVEFGKQIIGEKFDYSEIQSPNNLGAKLRVLLNLGLVERVSAEQQPYRKCLVWQGEQWTLGTQAFVWWVYQVVIVGTHSLPDFDDWLKNERYLSLLKPGQWERLVENVHSAVGPRIWDIRLMIENAFKEQDMEELK